MTIDMWDFVERDELEELRDLMEGADGQLEELF